MTCLCRARAARLKSQEPVEGRHQWAYLTRLQTGKSNAVFQQARHLLLARQASRVPAHLIKHPMTKSDAEGEKEGHMTRKLLMTVAIVAIALAPSIGIGPAQAHGFGGGGFHGGGFGGHGFYGGHGRGFLRRIRAWFLRRVWPRLLRRVWWFLSGLWVWLFPVLLLLLLIGYSWRRERRSSGTKPKLRRLGGALDFQCPTFSSSCWSRIPRRGDAGLS